jgi:hypothetical protein
MYPLEVVREWLDATCSALLSISILQEGAEVVSSELFDAMVAIIMPSVLVTMGRCSIISPCGSVLLLMLAVVAVGWGWHVARPPFD